MYKIVVLGDIHGRSIWKNIVEAEKDANKIVFLGDYVSTHEDISTEQINQNVEDILTFKEQNPDKVILLRGNHDMQHLGYSWAQCSGYNAGTAKFMIDNKVRFLYDTQWVYIYNNILFSHAGVSKRWMKDCEINSVEEINDEEPSWKFGFLPDSYNDCYGESITQPLTWIRPFPLYYCAVDEYIHVVGHTPKDGIKEIMNRIREETFTKLDELALLEGEDEEVAKEHLAERRQNFLDRISKSPGIWLCDTLGIRQYLTIIDNKFIIKNAMGS